MYLSIKMGFSVLQKLRMAFFVILCLLFQVKEVVAQCSLTTNLFASYNFTGNTLDSSGNGRTGLEYIGTGGSYSTGHEGKTNSAITEGTNTNNILVGGSSAAYTGPTVFSVMVWFKSSGVVNKGGNILAFGTLQGSGGTVDRSIYLESTGQVVFSNNATSIGGASQAQKLADRITSPLTTYNDGNWHHVAVTCSTGVAILYLDGVQVANSTLTAGQTATAGWWRFLRQYSPEEYAASIASCTDPCANGRQLYNGYVDDAYIFHGRILTATEIAQEYSFASSNSPVACGTTINLTAATRASTTYSWTGPNAFTSTSQNPSIPTSSFLNSGTYTLTATTTNCTPRYYQITVSSTGNIYPAASTTNLQTYYSFDALSTTDLSGKSNTASYQGTVPQVADQYGSSNLAIGPITTTNYFTSTKTFVNPTVFSIGIWFKTNTAAGGNLVRFGSNQTGTGGNNDRAINMTVGGNLTFSVFNGSTVTITSPLAYNDNQWHQTIATIGSGGMALYVDGVQVATNANTVPENTTGYWRNGYNSFNGYLDDFSFYDRVLTNTEISSFFLSPITKTTPICNGTLSLTSPTIAGATYAWTGPSSFTSSNQNPNISNVNTTNSGTYNLTITKGSCTASGSITTTINPLATPASINGLYTYYSFDNASFTDLSGKSNDGSLKGALASVTDQFGNANSAIGPFTTANYFSSSITYVNPNVFTIGIWFQTTTSSGGNLLGFGGNQTGTGGNNDRNITMTAAGNLTFSIFNGSNVAITSPLTYNDNLWHQAIATLGSGGMTLFIDGVQVANNAGITAGQNYTGYWRNGYSSFNGFLDEFSYYNRVLSNSEIATLFISPLSHNSPICNEVLTLTAPTIPTATYAWTGPNSFTSALQNPTISGVNAASSGTYNVTITRGACSVSSSTTISINPLPIPASTSGLYSYYSFDNGSTTDLSGRSNTASFIGSVPQVVDQFGNSNSALGPFSTSNYFTSTSTFTNPNVFTIGVWFQTTTSSGGNLLSFGGNQTGTGGNTDRSIDMTSAGNITFSVFPGFNVTITSPLTYNDNLWHQAVATLGSGGMILYIDGTQVAINTGITSAQTYNGYWRNGYSSFNGFIDEFSYYNRVLSSSEIASIYVSPILKDFPLCGGTLNLTSVSIPGAVYSWTGPNSFTSSTQNPSIASVTTLASGTYNLTITKGSCSATSSIAATITPLPAPASTNGLLTYYAFSNGATTTDLSLNSNTMVNIGSVGQVADLYGNANSAIGPFNTSSYITSTNQFSNPTTFTIGIWFKTNSGNTGSLISFGANQTGTGGNNDRAIEITTGGNITFSVFNGSTTTITSPLGYNDNLWHQAVATFGSGGMNLYVDGTLVASNANTVAQNYTGYWRNGYSSFTGYLDEFSYYNRVLTNAEISALYITPITANTPTCGGTFNLTAPTVAGASYSWTGPNSFTSSSQNPSISNISALYNGTFNVTITSGSCSSSGSVVLNVTSFPAIASTSGLLAYYGFNTGNTTKDLSGLNNTMVVQGTQTYVPDQFGNANSALGSVSTTNYFTSTTTYTNPTTFTIGIWFKTASASASGLVRFGANQTGTGGNNDRAILMNASGNVQFSVFNGSTVTITSPLSYNNNIWHQAVATLSSAGMLLYVDGVQVASNSNTTAQNYTGYWRNGYASFSGSLDDFSYYNRVLTNAEIASLYIEPVSSNAPACGGTLSLTAPILSGATYAWTGPASFTSNAMPATLANVQTPTNDGTYNVTVSSGTCSRSGSVSVAVATTGTPTLALTTTASTICAGTSVTFTATATKAGGGVTTYTFKNGVTTLQSSASNAYTTTTLTNGMVISCVMDIASPSTCMTGSPAAVSATSNSITMTVNAIPATPTLSTTAGGGTLPLTLCQGLTTFNITAAGGSTYSWTLPATASFVTGGSTATISKSIALTSSDAGTYSVVATANGCTSPSASTTLTVSPLPSTPGSITGTANVCQGQTGVVYSVPSISGATGYNWTLPTGGSITAGTNTSSITVSYSAGASNGNVVVNGTNACGSGSFSGNFAVTVNAGAPSAAGTITGTAAVCQGQTGINYTVPAITNATSYTWTTPTGATITSGSTSRSIFVTYTGSAVSGNFTVRGVNGCGNGTVSANFAVTVTSSIPGAAGTITGTSSVCQGKTGIVYSVASITGATGYTWSLPTGASITSGTNTNSITVSFSSSASSGNVTVLGTNPCGNGTISANFPVTVSSTQTWVGVTSTNWFTASNWCGQVPLATTNVIIPTGTTFSPNINAAGAVASNLTVQSAATLSMGTSGILTLAGNWSNSGTFTSGLGKVVFAGSTAQTIGGSSATSFFNLDIANTHPTTKLVGLASAQSIKGALTLSSNNTFATNGFVFTLINTPTDTLARVATLPSGASVTGNVTVQRYFPSLRGYRFVGSPVKLATFSQLQATTGAGTGTHVTGPGGAANGFDATYTNNPSCYGYDETVQGRSFRGYASIVGTSDSMRVGKAYKLFIRGDRTIDLTATESSQLGSINSTTLSVTGKINQGTISIPLTYTLTTAPQTGVFVALNNDGWNFVSNPYPCAIDWTLVTKNASVDNSVYLLNPITGTYVAYNPLIGSSPAVANANIIAPFQGFYVKTHAAGPTMSITESAKTGNQRRGYFRMDVFDAFVRLKLSSPSGESDETVVGIKEDASVLFDPSFDSYKLGGGNVGLSSLIDSTTNLAVNILPSKGVSNLYVPLSVTSSSLGKHILEIPYFGNLGVSNVYLNDNFLHTSIMISQDLVYPFYITSDPATKGNNRFELSIFQDGIIPTALEVQSKVLGAKVFPNPIVQGNISLAVSSDFGNVFQLEVFDNQGKLAYQKQYSLGTNEQNLVIKDNIGNLPQGLYTFKMTSKNQTLIQKMMVEGY